MPLTDKGQDILAHMERQYGEKKGKEVFYASRNKGTIAGVDSALAPAGVTLDAVARVCDDYDKAHECG